MSIKIGNLELDSPWVLAPLAGFTDAVMRTLCEEQGAALTYTEMVSAKGLYYGGSKTSDLTYIPDGAGPTAIQIFGSEPDIMAFAARELNGLKNEVLDINMGCPVPKVVRNGDGSALMRDPDLICRIVKAVTSATEKPVTVKIRKGFDEPNAVEAALAAQEGGASAVCVHGRTREQYYSGVVDRNIIKDVKDALSIPVIASGDVTNAETGMSMLAETGCDMVMIGRGALGNPWIFRELDAAYKGLDIPPRPSDEERTAMMLRHLEMLCRLKGESTGVKEFRKYIIRYTKGMHGAAAVRRRANDVLSLEEMKEVIQIG
ncbi:MAG: tRNA dihydrouridine synthase DusB [Mogibacterium sp.]|nr:tRNA dihydrouridine synthase DusB [Mogibacterium sp.]MBQ6500316.1 tRNA dihydrouridine synthase DusB [Mogibacterium sp.]